MNGADLFPEAVCPDCAVSIGVDHAGGCDVARCVVTGRQRLACVLAEDPGHDCGADVWTGEWPGVADALRLGFTTEDGPDLNRLAPPFAVWSPAARRWDLPDVLSVSGLPNAAEFCGMVMGQLEGRGVQVRAWDGVERPVVIRRQVAAALPLDDSGWLAKSAARVLANAVDLHTPGLVERAVAGAAWAWCWWAGAAGGSVAGEASDGLEVALAVGAWDGAGVGAHVGDDADP